LNEAQYLMTRALPFLLCAYLALSGCSRVDREVSVRDVTKSETIVLRKKPGQGPIYAISIVGSGSISGDAEFQLILNGAVYQKKGITGRSSFEFGGDWYSDEAELRYVPKHVSDGNLMLKYSFYD
jgi:hypothetical protein